MNNVSAALDDSSPSNRIGESMSGEINPHRRRSFGTAAVTVAAAQLGLMGFANAHSAKTDS